MTITENEQGEALIVCTLPEFLEANADAPTVCDLVRGLRVGDSVTIGGGASVAFVIGRWTTGAVSIRRAS